MEEIRRLKQEELLDSLTLSEFAFQYVLTEEDKARRIARTDPKQIWGYFVDGKMAAKLTILELQIWLNGKRYAMGGISGVATWPEYRRKGMVSQLLELSLRKMKEAGQSVSFLHPFSFSFYRKFGWEMFMDYVQYEIEAGQLPRFAAKEGSRVERVALDAELLHPIYEAYASRFNGMLVRDRDWWNHRVFKTGSHTAAVYRNALGELTGYVYYSISNHIFTVHELVFLDEDARCGLWKFISDHDSMMTTTIVKAPAQDKLSFLLADPRMKQERKPYFMARIVDVEAFISQYSFVAASVITGNPETHDIPGTPETLMTSMTSMSPRALRVSRPFYLQVSDAYAEWNQGLFEIIVDVSGEAKVTRQPELQLKEGAELLSCDIQTLSCLLMGYQKASFLHTIGRIQGNQAEVMRLEALIPDCTTYLTDYF
ncbi:GNAT family N-acetyltransferase [Paenibacillus eucommiae]|uniref:Acetyltransferase n=1 Tax=Paenibacillus eucommiae TaxID=1355755 RepID=A0ABS4IZI2_9BACL|nr:GNAT family N-acetyltransferase [Paenibacillus eucommiae]MBP1992955.1 putative acetyltransferase [Paenibacillus eucommiae]